MLLSLLPPNVTKHFSSHIIKVENIPGADGHRPTARLHIGPSQLHHHPDGPGEQWTFDADAVIGCDGVKSKIRQCLGFSNGPNGSGRVRYTGTYAYRGLLDMEAVVQKNGEGAREAIMWFAPDKVSQPTLFCRDMHGLTTPFSPAHAYRPRRGWEDHERGRLRIRSLTIT
jgi:salicylate hydroxylase